MADDNPVHVTTTEARSGSAPRIVRYVLVISLLLVVVAFAIIVAGGRVS